MRLLNTRTLELEYFPKGDKPPYAILSHTWGTEEVLFEDARHGSAKLRACPKRGLDKVTKSAELALSDGYDYVWIDTCCIDKSSSAELSEAINSMFAWYRQSDVCYAFLEDYTHGRSDLADSRWFTRGWTLQELIAPFDVRFYDSSWSMFGDRLQLSSTIAKITSVDHHVLSFTFTPQALCTNGKGHPLPAPTEFGDTTCHICRETTLTLLFQSYSVSTKMSWAARRETTRVEDVAYCMMGIFGVNMPLLYGEGGKAFRRLQEEIVRRSNDQTILAWRREMFSGEDLLQSSRSSIFASHPAQFRSGNSFHPIRAHMSRHSINHSSAGMEMDVHLVPCKFYSPDADIRSPNLGAQAGEAWLAVLNCSYKNDIFSSPALLLGKMDSDHKFCRRCFEHPFSRCQYVIVSEGRKSCEFLAEAPYPDLSNSLQRSKRQNYCQL
ncbi:HET-domain-containing protein [Podospora aff. communis PSN243]|uniref:HET-domain-containing protein n=1 Tax=Podospora aff. communis PSN243 TaxID=3040156 RepID=A0AAV9GC70_9PEZI|nr:HET-domain-containing protein [Podospora aff. communis PSN243]